MAEHGTQTGYRRGCRCDPCRTAKSISQRAYYEANQGQRLAYRRAYHEANREQELARSRAYSVFRNPIRRLERRLAQNTDLFRQLEAQLGLSPDTEVSPA